MTGLHDTIVAPITGTQRAAVAIVRLSGDRAWEIALALFSEAQPPARFAAYGTFAHGDDGLLILFEEGHSFTGEACAECHVHGSPASVRALVEHCIEAGARMAEPGEFTYRAFMNGRMDLTQAEGVRETIEAQTSRQLRQGSLMRAGALTEALRSVRDEVFAVLAMVEASVDFSEEIGELDHALAIARLPIPDLEGLLATSERSMLIREGVSVAIVGPPNAGKSSLLNRLLGADRAIVTAQEGTTRDTVEEAAEIGGLLVRFIDTAGLREASDEAEQLGIARSAEAAAMADQVWFVYDASAGWDKAEGEWERVGRPSVIVANKSDLAPPSSPTHIAISALTGAGVDVLTANLTQLDDCEPGLVNGRHTPLLARALASLRAAREVFENAVPDDLASVHLRDAAHALGEITGDTASEDMISRIFRDFCIGK